MESPDFEYYIPGAFTMDADLPEFDSTRCSYVNQPNSHFRKCFTIPQVFKDRMLENVSSKHFRSIIRNIYDKNFTEFKTVIGFITINRESSNQTKVDIHTDNSDFTVNVYLTDDFEGGKLTLVGRSDQLCPPFDKMACIQNDYSELRIEPQKNMMLVHRGNHKHMVEPLTKGQRYNLILWCYYDDRPDLLNGIDNTFVIKSS